MKQVTSMEQRTAHNSESLVQNKIKRVKSFVTPDEYRAGYLSNEMFSRGTQLRLYKEETHTCALGSTIL